MADWSTIASVATAGGTLVLAIATFSATRSSNRSARIAEQALQEQRRPVLVQARLDDPEQKVMFVDGRWLRVQGSDAVIEASDDGHVYLGLALRNVGAGIAVLQGWHVWPERVTSDIDHRHPDDFRRQQRDIYIAPGDIGMWQGALREDAGDVRDTLAGLLRDGEPFAIDLLYSDQLGGQRTISRFGVLPATESRWLGVVVRHWNLDTAGPR